AICVANGSNSLVCACGIPVVSSLATAIFEFALGTADDRLDGQHLPHLHHVALAHIGASMGSAARLGHAAGIWMRGHRCGNHLATPSTGGWARWYSIGLKEYIFLIFGPEVPLRHPGQCPFNLN